MHGCAAASPARVRDGRGRRRAQCRTGRESPDMPMAGVLKTHRQEWLLAPLPPPPSKAWLCWGCVSDRRDSVAKQNLAGAGGRGRLGPRTRVGTRLPAVAMTGTPPILRSGRAVADRPPHLVERPRIQADVTGYTYGSVWLRPGRIPSSPRWVAMARGVPSPCSSAPVTQRVVSGGHDESVPQTACFSAGPQVSGSSRGVQFSHCRCSRRQLGRFPILFSLSFSVGPQHWRWCRPMRSGVAVSPH